MHQAYLRSKSHLPSPCWEEYIYALSDRFGTKFDDTMSEIQEAFDRATTRLTLDLNHAISAFLNRLKPESGDGCLYEFIDPIPFLMHIT